MGLKLEAYKASDLHFENRLEGKDQQIQVRQKFNTRVNYYENNKCSCMYEFIATDINEEKPFRIHAEVNAIFTYDPGMTQAEIHVEATRQLYPYLKSTVTMLSTLAAAPPFIIQPHEVKVSDIEGGAKPAPVRS